MRALRLLMATDLIHHTENEIEPCINQGKTVVCDRYILSALAYGMIECSREWLDAITRGYRKPDAIFYLRIAPLEAIKRLGKKGFGLELFERDSYFRRVSENFDVLSREFDNVYIFDGEKPIDVVHKEIMKLYKQL